MENQLFQKLCERALKYTPEKVSIKKIKTLPLMKNPQYLKIAAGHNLTPEIIEEIEISVMNQLIQEAFSNKDKEQIKALEEMKIVLKKVKKYSYF